MTDEMHRILDISYMHTLTALDKIITQHTTITNIDIHDTKQLGILVILNSYNFLNNNQIFIQLPFYKYLYLRLKYKHHLYLKKNKNKIQTNMFNMNNLLVSLHQEMTLLFQDSDNDFTLIPAILSREVNKIA